MRETPTLRVKLKRRSGVGAVDGGAAEIHVQRSVSVSIKPSIRRGIKLNGRVKLR